MMVENMAGKNDRCGRHGRGAGRGVGKVVLSTISDLALEALYEKGVSTHNITSVLWGEMLLKWHASNLMF